MSRHLMKEVDLGVKCINVEPSPEELSEALAVESRRLFLSEMIRKIQVELEEISKHPSRVFEDSPGYVYDTRTFIASGNTSDI